MKKEELAKFLLKLLPRNKFFLSMGSVLNIFPSRIKSNYQKSDYEAISSDWAKVEEDLKSTFNN